MGIYWEVEVGQLAGVSGQTVGEWTRHGYVRASRSTVIDFAYSFEYVAEAIVAHELIDRGVPCEEIRQTIENTREKHGIFFFQAEDGIRDLYVTGVQTCALPISAVDAVRPRVDGSSGRDRR